LGVRTSKPKLGLVGVRVGVVASPFSPPTTCRRRATRGAKYGSVFLDPVSAARTTSRPASRAGAVAAAMAEGRARPAAHRPAPMGGGRPRD